VIRPRAMIKRRTLTGALAGWPALSRAQENEPLSATIDELETGLTAVATALDDPFAARSGGARLVSVSVSGPSARLPAERLPKVAARLERLARSLSRFAPAQSRAGR